MRVLFLTPSAGLGGAERALLEAIAALREAESRWSLRVVSLEHGPLLERCHELGAECTVVEAPPTLAGTGESGTTVVATTVGLMRGLPSLAGYAGRLRAHVSAWQPDIVHSNGIKTHVLGAWVGRGPALVWHVHDYLSERRLSPMLLRLHRRRVSLVLANSRSVEADVRRVLGDAAVLTAYNAVDVGRFRSGGPRIDLDAASGLDRAAAGTMRVGIVATYARWKGQDVFLEAVARLPPDLPVRAYVVGGPVYRTQGSQWSRAELEARCRALGLAGRVGFVDWADDASTVYRALDVVVHASTRPEPFGLAIAEAMACGRAVVVSWAGGAMEIGEDGATCLAHAPGDAADLARAIARLAVDAPLRATLGEAAARRISERFTRARLAATLQDAYRRVHAA